MGRYLLNLYANRQPEPFESKTVMIDQKPILRGLDQRRGNVQNAEIEYELPTNELSNCEEIVLSGFDIGYLSVTLEGNR